MFTTRKIPKLSLEFNILPWDKCFRFLSHRMSRDHAIKRPDPISDEFSINLMQASNLHFTKEQHKTVLVVWFFKVEIKNSFHYRTCEQMVGKTTIGNIINYFITAYIRFSDFCKRPHNYLNLIYNDSTKIKTKINVTVIIAQ